MQRGRFATAAAVVALTTSCVTASAPTTEDWCIGPPLTGDLLDRARSCMRVQAAHAYLVAAKRKALDIWVLPERIPAHRCAVVQFALARDGTFSSPPALVVGDNALMNASAVQALKESAPFDPIPEDALCLANLPLWSRFENPELR